MLTPTEIHYTPREMEIIKYLLMTFTRKEMTDICGISPDTLKSHFKNLMNKTGRHCETELILYFLTHDFSVNADLTEVKYKGEAL